MAALFNTFIVVACTGVSAPHMDMCQKTVDASFRQVGIRQQVDRAEDLTSSYVENKIKSKMSNTQLEIAGAGFAGYKIYRDKRVSFRLPNFGLCNSLSNDISLDTYSLNIGWRF